jgi:hypothetical protein
VNFDFVSYIRPKLSECLNFVKLALAIRGFLGVKLTSLAAQLRSLEQVDMKQ